MSHRADRESNPNTAVAFNGELPFSDQVVQETNHNSKLHKLRTDLGRMFDDASFSSIYSDPHGTIAKEWAILPVVPVTFVNGEAHSFQLARRTHSARGESSEDTFLCFAGQSNNPLLELLITDDYQTKEKLIDLASNTDVSFDEPKQVELFELVTKEILKKYQAHKEAITAKEETERVRVAREKLDRKTARHKQWIKVGKPIVGLIVGFGAVFGGMHGVKAIVDSARTTPAERAAEIKARNDKRQAFRDTITQKGYLRIGDKGRVLELNVSETKTMTNSAESNLLAATLAMKDNPAKALDQVVGLTAGDRNIGFDFRLPDKANDCSVVSIDSKTDESIVGAYIAAPSTAQSDYDVEVTEQTVKKSTGNGATNVIEVFAKVCDNGGVNNNPEDVTHSGWIQFVTKDKAPKL